MKLRLALVAVSLVLSLFLGLTISKGNRSTGTESGDQIVIGLSMDTLKETRWQKDRDYFVAKAESLGAKVLVQSANSDDARQIQDVQALLSNNVDVLVLIAHNAEAMAKAVELAHEAGVPVLAYERMITNCEPDLFISFDNVHIGELQAQFVVDHFPKHRPGRIVRIFGAKTDQAAVMFKQGQDHVLAPFIARGAIEILHEDWAENWKPENAKKITNAALTQHGANFDAILASNDGTAGGAIQALLEEGLAGKILVTGQDAELVACQRIAAGTQSMTIYKPISRLAAKAAELAVKLARGQCVIARQAVNNGKVEVPAVRLEVVTVTKENLNETVIADGFHQREEIFSDVQDVRH
ncbi:substrate-binding domain-containing protein [candidate division KSB1 bacterium]|nr:substrate-binding domain-containing protein [candidate division KSB1 bacterium]